MKKNLSRMMLIAALATSLTACQNMTTQQRNTAAGAAIGGVAGNLIGNNTASTLGGAALGGVIGSQIK